MNISNELKVGALASVAITALILGFSFLSGATLFAKTQKLYVKLEDADNVSPASQVKMYGTQIGKVRTIKREANGKYNVVFNITLENNVKIPKNSAVNIVELDLLGTKELRIVPSDASSYLSSGDTIVGMVKGGMMAVLESALDEKLDPLLSKTEPLLESIDTLIKNVNAKLLDNGAVENMISSLNVSLKNFEKISKRVDVLMESQSSNIEGILGNANSLTASINNNMGQIDSIISNFNTLSGKLSEMEFETLVASAETSLAEIEKLMTALNGTDGTLGKLLNEDGIYKGLDSTLLSINALIDDLKANPKRYVSFSLIARKDKSEKEE